MAIEIVPGVVEAAPVETATAIADPIVETPVAPEFKAIVLDSQDAADNFMKDRVARATRSAETKAAAEKKALEDRIAAFEDEKLSADEKKDKRIADAEKLAADALAENTKLQRTNVVRDLAEEAGLPKKLWDRVRGDTEDEITADIAELMEGIPAPAEPVKGTPPTRAPKVKLQSTNTEIDPGDNADAIVKGLSRGGF